MALGDACVFLGFLTSVLTQFFPKPPTTFLTYFSRGERRKYARNKVCLNQVSNSQPPGHESNKLTTEPPRWGLEWVENIVGNGENVGYQHFLHFPRSFPHAYFSNSGLCGKDYLYCR